MRRVHKVPIGGEAVTATSPTLVSANKDDRFRCRYLVTFPTTQPLWRQPLRNVCASLSTSLVLRRILELGLLSQRCLPMYFKIPHKIPVNVRDPHYQLRSGLGHRRTKVKSSRELAGLVDDRWVADTQEVLPRLSEFIGSPCKRCK